MTERVLRQHLHRVWFHWYRLQQALNAAHHANVIRYPQDKGEAPVRTVCEAHWETRTRFEMWTKDVLAETIQCAERSRAL